MTYHTGRERGTLALRRAPLTPVLSPQGRGRRLPSPSFPRGEGVRRADEGGARTRLGRVPNPSVPRSRAPHSWVAHSRGWLPQNPPWPPLGQGGKGKGAGRFSSPPCEGGVRG